MSPIFELLPKCFFCEENFSNFFWKVSFKISFKIEEYLTTQKHLRNLKILNAKSKKLLIECQCCFDNELIEDDMMPCPMGHLFCRDCIKRYAISQLGECKYKFKCFKENCEEQFSIETLRQLLEPNMFSNLLQNMQKEEIKNAKIPGLESCPSCGYSAIIDNPDEKIFQCFNKECLKETCRFCKELSHLPKGCEEAKRDIVTEKKEIDMRTFIENKVTEAMIRVCHKCGQRFYKTEGCNMMHCVCGAQMCYLCREPIQDYKHFTNDKYVLFILNYSQSLFLFLIFIIRLKTFKFP